jgi:ribonuclease BN (tRNA processing enzyme)
VPNAGLRLAAAGAVLAYTGDSGPDPGITGLARGAGLLLAEATYAGSVPPDAQAFLSSASQAGRHAAQAGAAHLALTHLWPGTSHQAARTAAAAEYHGQISVATPGLSLDLG